MASTSLPTFLRLRAGQPLAGTRRTLTAGIGVAVVMLAGSLVTAALLRLAMRAAGASAIADPLDLLVTPGAAGPASIWGYVLFESCLLPHRVFDTQAWYWGGGALLPAVAIAAQAFRGVRAAGRPADLPLLLAPALVVTAAAGLAELISSGDARPLEMSPLALLLPAAAVAASVAWTWLAGYRRSVPWLRGALSAAFAVPAGIALAAVPVFVLAPAGHEPPGVWMFAVLPYVPNAVLRAAFGDGLHAHTAVALLAFAVGSTAAAVHLRARSVTERVAFAACATALLAACTTVSTPVPSLAGAMSVLFHALPGALAVAFLGALLGPLIGRTATGHRLATIAALQALGDRLPPPPAAELTAADMEAERTATRDVVPVPRAAAAGGRLGPLALGGAVLAVLLAVALVAAVTFTGNTPEESAPELKAAHAYMDALATGQADRIWPTVTVDATAVPATTAVRLLGEADLARMLAVAGNQHSQISALRLDVAGRSRDTTLVRARYVEAGTARDTTLALAPVKGHWKVVLAPAAILVNGAEAAGLAVDGGQVAAAAGQPLAVLPGVHSVEATYRQPFLPGKVTVVADQPFTSPVTAQVAPHLDDAQLAAARATVGAALRRCAAATEPQPPGCPQAVLGPSGYVRWTVVGDPSATVSVVPDPVAAAVATGVFAMIGAWDVHVPEDVKHAASGGTFRAALAFAEGAWSITAGVSSDGAAVPRPPVADADLVAAVRAGFGQCTASRLLRPADCPQTLPSTYFVKNVVWRLDSDPLAGAQPGFDARRGVLTVSGEFAMTCAYNEGGQNRSAQSSGRYRADLLWDGQKVVLVSIDRG